MHLAFSNYELVNRAEINVALGKNGCGKSTLLKTFDSSVLGEEVGILKYITPDRGGSLIYQPNVESNMTANKSGSGTLAGLTSSSSSASRAWLSTGGWNR